MRRFSRSLFAVLAFYAPLAAAQVMVEDPWVRATVPGQTATGAFLRLTTLTPARLVAAKSPLTATVELHDMKIEAGVMRMQAIDEIPLTPNAVTELKPGGRHIMLMDLNRSLAVGNKVPLTLVVEMPDGKRQEYALEAEVRALDHEAGSAPAHGK